MLNKSKNIIYICTAEKKASGGAKIIYDHSQIINNSNSEFNSQIIHIAKKKNSKWKNSVNKLLKIETQNFSGWQSNEITIKKNFIYSWFKNKISTKENFDFTENDFVIFPEIFAHLAKKMCINKNIDFGIFVQNGYSLFSTNNLKSLDEVYKKSKVILSYSKNIDNCIKLAFPGCEKKIIKIQCSVDVKIKNSRNKKNLITYMPRKLPFHSRQVIFFLRNNLPKNWKIKPLHNLPQNLVYKNLNKSKIFLSFSNLEGLGLPPIEAAISGNKVIGYTGEAGKEYFKKPIFTEINSGNLIKFCNEILKEIKRKNFFKNSYNQRLNLKNKFSKKNEIMFVYKFLKKIKNIKKFDF